MEDRLIDLLETTTKKLEEMDRRPEQAADAFFMEELLENLDELSNQLDTLIEHGD